MNYSRLNVLTQQQLKELATKMDLPLSKNKDELIKNISNAFREYENYKRNKISKYTRVKQLGNKGKEGTTYLVTTRDGSEYAMKTFRKLKSSEKLKKESQLQKLVASVDAAPNVIDIDTVSKYIVMEKMDRHLIDVIEKQGGVLTKGQQKQIIGIYKKMDEVNVFHADANLMNYMFKGKKMYIIDFGMAKEITNSLIRKLGTSTPNIHIMTLGLVLKLKELNFSAESYSYLINFLSDEQIRQFGI